MRPRVAFACAAALLGTVALIAYTPIHAVDFFWHLKLGALIASEHRIPATDTFSAVHPERPYVQLQWLWELGAHGVHRLLGLRGIRVVHACLMVLSFVALGWAVRRAAGSLAAFVVCAAALVLFEDRMETRPSALLLGFVALSLPRLVGEAPVRRRADLAWVALLGCAWSNLDGGEALLLPLCLAARALGIAYDTHRGTAPGGALPRASLQLVAACMGCLLSPTLIAGMRSFSEAIGPQLATGNQEWLPAYTMLRYGLSASHLAIALGPTLVAVAYVVYLARVPAARVSAEVLVAVGLLGVAHHAVRNAVLCIVPVVFMLRHLKVDPLAAWRDRAALLSGFALLFVALHDHVIDGYGGIAQARAAIASDLAPNVFPEELATFMEEAGIEGPVLNDARWGGYLLWRLWPACTVFADSRQDLTPALWKVMLATQSPDLRPHAMAHAFRAHRLELAVFRGPTFPVLRPDPAWQLLFKAGDQELYQHREGAHARANLARTRAWLARVRGSAPRDDDALARMATEEGAARWLAAPYRRWLTARSERLRRAPTARARIEGLRLAGNLRYDAGDHREARALLEGLLAEAPDDVVARYRVALASYALGDDDAARAHLARLHASPADLTRHQQERLRVLAHVLRVR